MDSCISLSNIEEFLKNKVEYDTFLRNYFLNYDYSIDSIDKFIDYVYVNFCTCKDLLTYINDNQKERFNRCIETLKEVDRFKIADAIRFYNNNIDDVFLNDYLRSKIAFEFGCKYFNAINQDKFLANTDIVDIAKEIKSFKDYYKSNIDKLEQIVANFMSKEYLIINIQHIGQNFLHNVRTIDNEVYQKGMCLFNGLLAVFENNLNVENSFQYKLLLDEAYAFLKNEKSPYYTTKTSINEKRVKLLDEWILSSNNKFTLTNELIELEQNLSNELKEALNNNKLNEFMLDLPNKLSKMNYQEIQYISTRIMK